ncbi:hypothetical protein H310_06973 [Aphanomyces invadans]|uniref:Uncharacterized protein n=1 Tax=Aphanomyces invadans TaxID=157072 RepID=A0A024U5D7_9STRA|nr:hypothetical protein H310_06973 [Aphanomyces invadans]ETW01459.1 hypothetical protein H310_06973 [Aphanomyces invadans]|eukprot:XP_008870457.1 hypothetical protein H310_06973 [Aphanomyces invadans]
MATALLLHAFYASCIADDSPQIRSMWLKRLQIISPPHAADLQLLIHAVDVRQLRPELASWNIHHERWGCFRELVSFLRDVPKEGLRYMTIQPLHLQTLLGQAMAFQEISATGRPFAEASDTSLALVESTNGEMPAWDCFNSSWSSLHRRFTPASLYLDGESRRGIRRVSHVTPMPRSSLPSRQTPPWPTTTVSDDLTLPVLSQPVPVLQDFSCQTDPASICHRASQTKTTLVSTIATTQTDTPPAVHHQFVQASLHVDSQHSQTQTTMLPTRHTPTQTIATANESSSTQTIPTSATHIACQTVESMPVARWDTTKRAATSDNAPNNQAEGRPMLKNEQAESSCCLEEPEESVDGDKVEVGSNRGDDNLNTTLRAQAPPVDVPSSQWETIAIGQGAPPSSPAAPSRNDMIRLSEAWSQIDAVPSRPLQVQPCAKPPRDVESASPAMILLTQAVVTSQNSRLSFRHESRPNAWMGESSLVKSDQAQLTPPQGPPRPQPRQPLRVGATMAFAQEERAAILRATVIAESRESQAIRAMSISHSGKYIAMGTNARVLRVLNIHDAIGKAASGLPLATRQLLPVVSEHYKHHSGPIYCLAWHPRDVVVASVGSSDGSIHLAKPFALDAAPVGLSGHPGKVRAVQFCPQNGHIVGSVGSGDALVRIWDAHAVQAAPIMQMHGHVGELTSFEFARAGDVCVTGSQDRTVRLWDLRSEASQSILQGTSPVQAVTCHPRQADWIASGHSDGSCLVWDRRHAASPLATMRHHGKECRVVAWQGPSSNDSFLLTGSFDGTTCVVTDKWTVLGTFQENDDMILQGQWHPSVPAFATSGGDKALKLWKLS